MQPLSQIHRDAEGRQTAAIVIDALDECEHDNDIKLVIYLFSQMGVLPFARFRIFITSRPDLPVRLGFQDGAKLASRLGNIVKIWDTATAACLQTLEGHRGPVWSVAFLVNGTKLASASEDKTIEIWDAVTDVCLKTFSGHNSAINLIASTQDGKTLASASADNSVKIWDIAKSVCLQVLQGHKD